MAVTRIQSINVNSSLPQAIRHRFNPPEGKEKLIEFDMYLPYDMPDIHFEDMYEIEKYSDSDEEFMTEIMRYIESSGYAQKIRKNAVVQEIVISYSPEDFENESENRIKSLIKEDIFLFSKIFKEKFGFKPFYIHFIHKNNTGIYHAHIIFSLKKPDLKSKVRWKKRTYFELIRKLESKSPRITVPRRNKGIGAYPLWLIRKLEKEYGEEVAKKIVKIAREKGYRTRELIDNAEKLAKEIMHPNNRSLTQQLNQKRSR